MLIVSSCVLNWILHPSYCTLSVTLYACYGDMTLQPGQESTYFLPPFVVVIPIAFFASVL